MVDYNKEDLSKIDKKEILAIMKRGFQAPVELTRTIHCNPKYPEFHNVFIPKINEKNGMIHIKDKWNLIDKNELSDDIYHRKRDYIIQNLEYYIDQLDEFKIKSLKRWLNTVDDDDEAIINTKKDIKNVLYENRALAMNQKKLLEKQKKQLEIVNLPKNEKSKVNDKLLKLFDLKKEKSISSPENSEDSDTSSSSSSSDGEYSCNVNDSDDESSSDGDVDSIEKNDMFLRP